MQAIADISDKIYGTHPVACYRSPTHDATLARAIRPPGEIHPRYLYLQLVFRRPAPSDPCLVISSEITEEGRKPVLGIYDGAGHEILSDEIGDWTDLTTFSRKAVGLAADRFATNFAENVIRKMPTIICPSCGTENQAKERYCSTCSEDLDRAG